MSLKSGEGIFIQPLLSLHPSTLLPEYCAYALDRHEVTPEMRQSLWWKSRGEMCHWVKTRDGVKLGGKKCLSSFSRLTLPT